MHAEAIYLFALVMIHSHDNASLVDIKSIKTGTNIEIELETDCASINGAVPPDTFETCQRPSYSPKDFVIHTCRDLASPPRTTTMAAH